MTAILNALQAGHNPKQILEFIKKLNPGLAAQITAAQLAGKSVDKILSYLAQYGDKIDKSMSSTKQYRGSQQAIYGVSKEAKNIAKAGMTAAALAGGYALAKNLTKTAGAIMPSEILPAQKVIGQQPQKLLGYQSPRGLPAPGIPGGTKPITPIPPTQATAPTPANVPITPITNAPSPATTPNIPNVAEKAVQSATSLNLMRHIQDLSKRINDPKAVAAVLYNQFPKEMTQFQKEVGKPMEDAIADIVSSMPEPEQPQQKQAITPTPQQPQPIQQPISQPEKENIPPTNVKKAAFGAEPLKKLSEAKPLKEHSFSIPTYKLPSETPEEFKNREILDSAIEKAAKALSEGKSFLDFPDPFGKVEREEKTISRGPRKGEVETKVKHERFTRSMASDVLRFMGGIPNVYDPLLDDEEKAELNEAFEEEGMPALKASLPSGDANIYGAQMTPNLVWNLLLSVEPRLQDVEIPQSVKGYKMAPGKKMGTAELRRYLTHAVYGALSGKKLSTQLKDKISKISGVANHLDVLAKAVKEGNLRSMIEEEERLSKYDEEFYNLFTEEVLERARKIK